MMQDIKGISSTIVGAGGATISWLDITNTVVQIVAGILGAIASGYAIYYYIKKGKKS